MLICSAPSTKTLPFVAIAARPNEAAYLLIEERQLQVEKLF